MWWCHGSAIHFTDDWKFANEQVDYSIGSFKMVIEALYQKMNIGCIYTDEQEPTRNVALQADS